MNDDQALKLAQDSAARMFADDLASQRLGIDIEVIAPGRVAATMTVREDMVNGHAICHGGYIFTLADTAFAFACNTYGSVAVAASAGIDFIAPARAGERLCAEAAEAHRRTRSGLYDVRVTETESGRLVALFRGRSVTLRGDTGTRN